MAPALVQAFASGYATQRHALQQRATSARATPNHAPRWKCRTVRCSAEKKTGTPPPSPLDAFGALERILRDSASSRQAGGSGRWELVQGAWVLFPASDALPPSAVVHFVGGAFVGASPQLAYRLLLERICSKGFVIVATPYSMSFDHLRIADEVQFTFDRAARALGDPVASLPVFGLGHSMGALAHCLVAARYNVTRAGNVLLSFNNKPATDAIPLFLPVVAPLAQGLNPLLTSWATSPLRGGVDMIQSQLRGAAPPLLRELLPLLDQLEPLVLDVTSGRTEFTPAPAESARLMRTFYSVRRNLLVKFTDDSIDETASLAAILQESAAASTLDLTALAGDHVRPLGQMVPAEIAGAVQSGAATGTAFIDTLSSFADAVGVPNASRFPLEMLRNGVTEAARSTAPVGDEAAAADAVASLADDIAVWMASGLASTPAPSAPPQPLWGPMPSTE